MAFPVNENPRETWWVLAIAGVVSILFGVMALVWPGITLLTLVWLFGAFVFATGIAELVAFVRAMRDGQVWWTHLVLGIISIVAGLYILANPGLSALTLVFVIAFWAIVLGLFEVISAFVTGQFLWMIAGVVGILFGLLLLTNPVAGALAYLVVIGVFAIIRGVLLLVQAFRVPSRAAIG